MHGRRRADIDQYADPYEYGDTHQYADPYEYGDTHQYADPYADADEHRLAPAHPNPRPERYARGYSNACAAHRFARGIHSGADHAYSLWRCGTSHNCTTHRRRPRQRLATMATSNLVATRGRRRSCRSGGHSAAKGQTVTQAPFFRPQRSRKVCFGGNRISEVEGRVGFSPAEGGQNPRLPD